MRGDRRGELAWVAEQLMLNVDRVVFINETPAKANQTSTIDRSQGLIRPRAKISGTSSLQVENQFIEIFAFRPDFQPAKSHKF